MEKTKQLLYLYVSYCQFHVTSFLFIILPYFTDEETEVQRGNVTHQACTYSR